MHRRATIGAILSTAALAASLAPAAGWAEVGASGTRLSIAGGPVRSYMTYGHAEEPELYAPVSQELKRLQITFIRRGDNYQVMFKGAKVAEWPVATSRQDVPETGDPCVLELGGMVFVPLRALSDLCSFDVQWNRTSNMVALVPGTGKRPSEAHVNPVRPRTNPPNPQAALPDTPTAGLVMLNGVTFEQKGASVVIHVQADAPVRTSWKVVRSPKPYRIVLDFAGAKWSPDAQLPGPQGPINEIRRGQLDGSTARLVLEVPSLDVKVTSLKRDNAEVLASVGYGTAMAKNTLETVPPLTPDQRNVLKIIRRDGASRKGSRQWGGPDLRSRIPAGDLSGKVICLDAGHGGHDTGAQGVSNNEKDLTLQMVKALRENLVARGATVILTRESDTFVSLDDRVKIANENNADIFVSIHLNSTPKRNSGSGTESYWWTPQSSRLARMMHSSLASVVEWPDRRSRNNRRFFVIRNTFMPSVLLEIGYINNASEELILAQPEFQHKLADQLTGGLLEYFGAGGDVISGG